MATTSSSSGQQPRSILGTPGSRIRVILGETGKDYVLLLNEDDGNSEWQKVDWRGCGSGFPNSVGRQIDNCTNKGRYVREIDFNATTEAWFVSGIRRDGTGEYAWWGNTSAASAIKDADDQRVLVCFGSNYNRRETYVVLNGRNGYSTSSNVHEDLKSRLNRINRRKMNVEFVRLFDDGAYFISDDEGTEWCGFCDHCSKELKNGTGAICDVAVAGDGAWIVVRDDYFEASQGIPGHLIRDLTSFYTRQKNSIKARQREFNEFKAERVRQAEQERLAQEAAEREQRAAAERERLEREAREEEERRLAREAEERELAEALERQQRELEAENIVSQLEEECREIQVLEKLVNKRKREVRSSLEALPPYQRARVEQVTSSIKSLVSPSKAACVICHDDEVQRALVPCGHHCLCDGCSAQLMVTARQCPLCREPVYSTLKIYSQS